MTAFNDIYNHVADDVSVVGKIFFNWRNASWEITTGSMVKIRLSVDVIKRKYPLKKNKFLVLSVNLSIRPSWPGLRERLLCFYLFLQILSRIMYDCASRVVTNIYWDWNESYVDIENNSWVNECSHEVIKCPLIESLGAHTQQAVQLSWSLLCPGQIERTSLSELSLIMEPLPSSVRWTNSVKVFIELLMRGARIIYQHWQLDTNQWFIDQTKTKDIR